MGKRGGVRQRLKRLKLQCIPLPSILLCNAQSIRNKVDELQANVIHLEKFRDACIMAFTETWLTSNDPETDLSLSGFGVPIRLDRDADVTGKSHGGGVCLYVNERWCRNITVRETVCTADIELLSVSVRPFYLPREFPQIFLTVVYIHPKANVDNAVSAIHKVTHKLQSLCPDAPCFILGDFNHCDLKSMNNFYQYISCPTRLNKTIDLCYGSIKGAYKAVALPPLGSSDHNTILLTPTYKTLLKRGKTTIRQVEMWTDGAIDELKGAFEYKAALAAHEATDISKQPLSTPWQEATPVRSRGYLRPRSRALKSRVAAVEATRVPDGIPDSFTERLVRVEEAVRDIRECLQRLASPPPPTPSSPGARRRLTFGDTPGDPTLPAPDPVAPCAVTPDVAVRALPAEREEEFFRLCQTRPDTYAASVFMALTPFQVYKCWGKNVNWSGTNGKWPLPDNLKERVHQHVSQRFPNLSGDQWQKVRNRINERLRSPRKADPETQRAGFSR
ncbi:hypothetical protein D5F01_LYC02304 [Larimichthys crocea]|uniref:Endonuclease/exonuclease/phosphatase domain-containing protein n=1 Tax=Larimichthys crocea TaxID=215358 RepID=A0A6G0J2R9_LARCR|nr:hypothetical protein D5F01_LYC02304 [Larimichthys crocea]